MAEIESAQIIAFYLFDVAESADLRAVPALVGGSAVPARLAPKPPAPAYVEYGTPPISVDGERLGLSPIEGVHTRVRVYDYGVVSIALSRPFRGSWDELIGRSLALVDSPELEARAAQLAREVKQRLEPALIGCREAFLAEDYVVFAVHELEAPVDADTLLAARGSDIAAILRGERQRLSSQERSAILAHRLSYLATDLVVATWNTAFVFDTPAGAQATLEILEFANSQLLEFRHYDQLLDRELERIYRQLKEGRRPGIWASRRYTAAARQVHALFIDVNALTDRTENTVKFIGDIYAVRLFALVAARLGLDTWKADVQAKLRTVDDIYRFAVEQASIARGHLLEFIVVLILLLELVPFLLGLLS